MFTRENCPFKSTALVGFDQSEPRSAEKVRVEVEAPPGKADFAIFAEGGVRYVSPSGNPQI